MPWHTGQGRRCDLGFTAQQGAGVPSHTSVRQVCAVGDFPQPTIVLGWSSALDRVAPSSRRGHHSQRLDPPSARTPFTSCGGPTRAEECPV